MIWEVTTFVVGTVALIGGIVFWRFRDRTFDGEWIEERHAMWKAAQIQKERLDPLLKQAYEHDERIEKVIQQVDPNWRLGMSRDHIELSHSVEADEWRARLKHGG